MKVSVGESANIVGREGTKATIADTGRIKSKNSQLLRQEEQIKLLQKGKRKGTGKQAKEQQSMMPTKERK